MSRSEPPAVLLLHDGELADVVELLASFGTPFADRRGEIEPDERKATWDLIVATPRRMLALPAHTLGRASTQIVICEQDSRTLRNSLRRVGIGLIVRRPVHPAALRALLLRVLYRGPEKRRMARVSIGAPIRYRAGWRQRTAILADLSLGGCCLLSEHPIATERRIVLLIPSEVSGGKPFSLKARTLRVGPAEGQPRGVLAITARFGDVRRGALASLKATIAAHSAGPASFDGATPQAAAPEAPTAACDAAAARADAEPHGERRGELRHALARRVIALGDEASRVLMGRDISLAGMRVDPNPLLAPGLSLRLALHVNGLEVPLVVSAEVLRDDGARGVVLRFAELSSDARRYLSSTVECLPVLETARDEEGSGAVVSEILELRSA